MPYNPHLQDNYTPEQAEVMDFSPKVSFFALGTVTRCMDDEHAGRIEVDSPAFPEGPEQCDYLSPIGGAGYGFFAVPGIGATVLVGCVPYADPPNRYFWMGCLYAAGQEVQQDMNAFWKSGQPFIRLTGSALAACLLMIAGLILVVVYNGLGSFWPSDLLAYKLDDGEMVLGQVWDRQEMPDQPP